MQIQLIGYSRVAGCEGNPGDIVDCEDKERAAWMLKTGNARPVAAAPASKADAKVETADNTPKAETADDPPKPKRNANTAAKRKKKPETAAE